MGIRANHCVAGHNDPFFRQQSVLHAHFADVVEMLDAVFRGEGTHLLGMLCRFDILVGDEVIHH